MQVERERVPSSLTPDIFRAYVAVLPRWLRRFQISASDAEDLTQEVWLAICEGSVPLTSDVAKARLPLFKVTRLAAQRMRRRQMWEAHRYLPEPENHSDDFDVEEHAANALAVFEAIDRLEAPHRQLAIDYHVLGYTIKEIADRAGIRESTMERRVWRASAELVKMVQDDERKQKGHRKNERQSALIIAPCALCLDSETRAAFCAIWDAEGRAPVFGGAPPPPSSIAPVLPVAPILSLVTGSIVAAVGFALLLVLLVVVPAGLVAMHYFWKPVHPETAQSGIRVPPVPGLGAIKVVDEVVPPYPISVPVVGVSAPAAPQPVRVPEASGGPVFERLTND